MAKSRIGAKANADPGGPPVPCEGEAPEGSPWVVGRSYFIRTVTMHLVGRLAAAYPGELLLEDAAWVADSGRFADALRTGSLREVEPFPGRVIVGRGSVVDACGWEHPLPLTQK